MITVDEASSIHSKLCEEIRVNAVGEHVFEIDMPLTFGDGDACRIQIQKTDDNYLLCDSGKVFAIAAMQGVNLQSASFESQRHRLLQFYGATETEGQLTMSVDRASLGDAVFGFAQACTEIFQLSRIRDNPRRSTKSVKSELLALISTTVLPAINVEQDWHDESLDHADVYPVDFRLTGRSEWFFFGAGSVSSCWRSAATVLKYRNKGSRARTVYAYSESVKANPHAFAALKDTADDFFSVELEQNGLRELLASVK